MADPRAGRPRPGWLAALAQTGEFLGDVFWLVGWGARRLGLSRGEDARPASLRGCLGCLGSALAVLFAALLWRQRGR